MQLVQNHVFPLTAVLRPTEKERISGFNKWNLLFTTEYLNDEKCNNNSI